MRFLPWKWPGVISNIDLQRKTLHQRLALIHKNHHSGIVGTTGESPAIDQIG
jgi:hypothetical protein